MDDDRNHYTTNAISVLLGVIFRIFAEGIIRFINDRLKRSKGDKEAP